MNEYGISDLLAAFSAEAVVIDGEETSDTALGYEYAGQDFSYMSDAIGYLNRMDKKGFELVSHQRAEGYEHRHSIIVRRAVT